LASTRLTWVLTVASLSTSSAAISAFESPRAISVSTSASRAAASFLGLIAGALLIFFAAHLHRALQAAGGERSVLPLVAFGGAVTMAIAFAVAGAIALAAAAGVSTAPRWRR
jgi:hypothetical protein